MKKVKINAYQVGLVFKNGGYKRMLTAGNYWLWYSETVVVYELNRPFYPFVELNMLLQDAALANALHVIEVSDNQIALQYENGLLKNVLSAGQYAFWKGVIQYEFVKANIDSIEIDKSISLATLQHNVLAAYVRSYSVENHEKALLFVNGEYVKMLQPGLHYWWKNSTVILVTKVDTRAQQLEVNGQEILTKDKAALRINAQAQYRVTNIEKAILQNKEYDKQLYVAFQLVLREYIAGFSFDEVLEKKETMASFVLQQVKAKAEQLGIEVIDFGIRDIILPGDIKEIMNKVLIAEKTAQANTIMRREETASTRSLLNTAKLMEENAMLWKLKEMEYVEKIADKIGEITVNGNGALLEQLKQIFITK